MELLLLVLDDELMAGLGSAGDGPTEEDPPPIVPDMMFMFAFELPLAKAFILLEMPFIMLEPALDELGAELDADEPSRALLRFMPIRSCCCILMFSRICFCKSSTDLGFVEDDDDVDEGRAGGADICRVMPP